MRRDDHELVRSVRAVWQRENRGGKRIAGDALERAAQWAAAGRGDRVRSTIEGAARVKTLLARHRRKDASLSLSAVLAAADRDGLRGDPELTYALLHYSRRGDMLVPKKRSPAR